MVRARARGRTPRERRRLPPGRPRLRARPRRGARPAAALPASHFPIFHHFLLTTSSNHANFFDPFCEFLENPSEDNISQRVSGHSEYCLQFREIPAKSEKNVEQNCGFIVFSWFWKGVGFQKTMIFKSMFNFKAKTLILQKLVSYLEKIYKINDSRGINQKTMKNRIKIKDKK